jgi:hypothetical protein
VACYLYGWASAAPRAADLRGVDGAPVRGVPADGLTLVVSDIDDGAQVADSEASRHLDVLLGILQDGPVLPATFGTVAPDERYLTDEITPRLPELRSELDRLRDLVEIDVTALDDEASAVRAVVAAAPDRWRPGGDPLVLGERVAAAVMEHRGRVAEEIVLRLRKLSVQDTARRQVSNPEEPFLQWAFLLRRDRVEDFDDEVAQIMEQTPGLMVQSVGPLPPFSFVSTSAVDSPTSSAVQQGAAPASERTDPFRSGKWGW